MAITSEEAHASFKDFQRKEEHEINEGRLAVSEDVLGIDIDGFRFEVTSKLTPHQIRMGADYNSDNTYTEIIEVYAKFMASVSIDSRMKTPEFWIEFDEETGYLPDVVKFVITNTERQAPVIKKFR